MWPSLSLYYCAIQKLLCISVLLCNNSAKKKHISWLEEWLFIPKSWYISQWCTQLLSLLNNTTHMHDKKKSEDFSKTYNNLVNFLTCLGLRIWDFTITLGPQSMWRTIKNTLWILPSPRHLLPPLLPPPLPPSSPLCGEIRCFRLLRKQGKSRQK